MTYTEYLAEKAGIQPNQIPWYERWVRLYREKGENEVHLAEFMRDRYEDWQIKQALKAVSLYHSWKKEFSSVQVQNTGESADWDDILRKTREALRLHQLSLRTEKTYLH